MNRKTSNGPGSWPACTGYASGEEIKRQQSSSGEPFRQLVRFPDASKGNVTFARKFHYLRGLLLILLLLAISVLGATPLTVAKAQSGSQILLEFSGVLGPGGQYTCRTIANSSS